MTAPTAAAAANQITTYTEEPLIVLPRYIFASYVLPLPSRSASVTLIQEYLQEPLSATARMVEPNEGARSAALIQNIIGLSDNWRNIVVDNIIRALFDACRNGQYKNALHYAIQSERENTPESRGLANISTYSVLHSGMGGFSAEEMDRLKNPLKQQLLSLLHNRYWVLFEPQGIEQALTDYRAEGVLAAAMQQAGMNPESTMNLPIKLWMNLTAEQDAITHRMKHVICTIGTISTRIQWHATEDRPADPEPMLERTYVSMIQTCLARLGQAVANIWRNMQF